MSSTDARSLYDDGEYRRSDMPTRKRTNPLLVRTITGKVRPTTYKLPNAGFTYGKRDQFDDEGVREIVGSWHEHIPNPEGKPGRDFVRLNKKALGEGAVTSSQMAGYRHTHDIRLRNKVGSSTIRSSSAGWPQALSALTFGRPSRPSTPIHAVICNAYQRTWIEEQRQKTATGAQETVGEKKNIGRFGSSMHTRASLGHMKVPAPEPPQPFKMKRFAEVKAKVKPGNPNETIQTEQPASLVPSAQTAPSASAEQSNANSILGNAGQAVAEQAQQA